MLSAKRRAAVANGSFLLQRSDYAPHLGGLLDGAPLLNLAVNGADQTAVEEQPHEADLWGPFFVATLKQSVTKLLQVQLENGTLLDLLGCYDGF